MFLLTTNIIDIT